MGKGLKPHYFPFVKSIMINQIGSKVNHATAPSVTTYLVRAETNLARIRLLTLVWRRSTLRYVR